MIRLFTHCEPGSRKAPRYSTVHGNHKLPTLILGLRATTIPEPTVRPPTSIHGFVHHFMDNLGVGKCREASWRLVGRLGIGHTSPMGSIYGIFAYISLIFVVNVGKSIMLFNL